MADVVGEPVRPREPNTRLCRLMEHDVYAVEQHRKIRRPQICVDEVEARPGSCRCEVLLLRGAPVICREAIDAAYGVAPREQGVD